MNFLVTGGAGFIGSHVCERLLARGEQVCAVDDLNPFYELSLKQENLEQLTRIGGSRFQFIRADIMDRPALDRVFAAARYDQVIHLAARVGIRASLEAPALYQRINVEGTVNVLEAARAGGVRKLILASSSSVYGINPRIPFCESDSVLTPISPYAASKLACEALGQVYHQLYGLDVVMLRLFSVYGPRQRPDLTIHKFARLMAAGQPVPVFGDGSAARDYTYVEDIVDGVLACTRRGFGYEIFNLGGEHSVTLMRLIDLLQPALGVPAALDFQPPQPGDVPVTLANVEKARRMLAYDPVTSIEMGVQKFAEWFLPRPGGGLSRIGLSGRSTAWD